MRDDSHAISPGASALSVGIDSFYRSLSWIGSRWPSADPARYGIHVVQDVAYGLDSPMHRLDVWVPSKFPAPRPSLLYLHGGGFRILSKETHWIMALSFARRGYVVFNANYRLAPQHPFPAPLQDACLAYQWVVQNAHRYGADVQRLVLAGESAGANLATALTVAACFERKEPYARNVFDTTIVPKALLPACGILQVSNPERFLDDPAIHPWVMNRIVSVSKAYLPDPKVEGADLASPLLVLESTACPVRPLPPCHAIVGADDPIRRDSLRLEKALSHRASPVEVRSYPRQGHAFHAFVWRAQAKAAWKDTFHFLDQNL
ncbi:MAG TPA: alpha/beta hydrolase [Polyangiaceae bacterium]|nr:alpha/beta hydrolase [Polyangiaceae bacterium]HNZ23970.1 alpha/beta hydrolase [Polyangiaceae bacterium]HOD21779.1 alpha/beta hydrolase [Polyangiaceae bacterium]HOE49489.1 alpha/beta hydrolase [Polyangiaceae bacterium]HOH02253.1 alpha/beta hydrolase [Polyangiaceae bacterium]